jgi:hypothetical protein
MPLDQPFRRRKAGKVTLAPVVLDHGPAAQHRAGRLELVDAADPDAPSRTIRRARVVCIYDLAWRGGHITDAEREACDRYAVLCEREAGGRDRVDGPTTRADPWARAPAYTAIQAAASLRAVHAVVGPDGAALLRLYIRDNVPIPEIARRRGEERHLCTGRVRAAIRRLAEHWEMA